MIVYPAIDLRGGRCVRLRQGEFEAQTVFADDPVDASRRWAGEGAEWLHVVNLDGALGESAAANLDALARILAAVDLPIQFGGGLRAIEDIDRLLGMGVQRAILGTVAVRQPEIVRQAIERHGAEHIVVGIDARDGRVAVQGWTDTTDVDAIELARGMREMGARRVVYTDISRDGMLTGVNVEATARLAREAGVGAIASGGVASLDDIGRVTANADSGVEGVIVGMALYRGAIDLGEALCIARGKDES